MASLSRWCIALALLFVSVASQASVPLVSGWRVTWNGVTYQTWPSKSDACLDPALQAAVSANAASAGYASGTTFVEDSANGYCRVKNIAKTTGAVTLGGYVSISGNGQICPANSTSSGGSCVCMSPYVEDSTHTSCVAPLSELAQFCKDGADNKFTWHQSGTIGKSSSMPTGSCYKPYPPFPGPDAVRGCTTVLGSGVMVPREGDPLLKDWSATGVMTGAVCEDAVATDAAPKSADDPCPSGFPGTVNGETKCIAAEPDKGIEGVKGTSQTNADGTKIDTKETTKCLGTVCTTTTNTTTTTSTGTVTNSTSSRTESLGDKCTKDPKNDVCKKTQGGAGSATSDMTCDTNASAKGCGGDGAAIGDLYAKKDKTVAQALVKAKDGLLASPVGAAVGNFFSVSGGGSCTAVSAAIPFLNKTITIDTWCSTFALNMMAIVKTVLLMLASFMAFRVAIDY